MHVIGTAGHIDHGKSTLIRALTGIDPDRLKEEKERGMTIDLGFAWITLPSGREAGIVDVPGHHRFVPNMLAGVGGIDLVLFVVAATESWMPQSQEHLDIVHLLSIEHGLVVLTKTDLVEPEWLEMVTEEVREKLTGSSLSAAEILTVSAVTGAGIDRLRERIDALLTVIPQAPDTGRPRLWIDRVFTIRGAGTVATGTLEGGSLALEQQVVVLPGGMTARIRGLQTHRRPVEVVEPGTRVAVNLAGVDTALLQRGDALALPGQRRTTDLVNVELTTLPTLDHALPQECELKMYCGTAEHRVRVRLLDRAELPPGDTVLAQLRLERGAALDFHDRFILRDAARQQTVGGGIVLDTRAERVRGADLRLPLSAPGAYKVLSTSGVPVRRLDLGLLRTRRDADPNMLILAILAERGWASLSELALEVPLAAPELQERLAELAASGQLVLLPGHAVARDAWQALRARLEAVLQAHHTQYPLRSGVNRETVRSTLGMPERLFEEAVARFCQAGELVAAGALLRLPSFRPVLTAAQERSAAEVEAMLEAAPFNPPETDALLQACDGDAELLNALVEQGRLVRINRELMMSAGAVAEAKRRIAGAMAESGSIDVGTVRDLLGTSRKYVVPLLEYLDQVGFTRRVGDKRVLA